MLSKSLDCIEWLAATILWIASTICRLAEFAVMLISYICFIVFSVVVIGIALSICAVLALIGWFFRQF